MDRGPRDAELPKRKIKLTRREPRIYTEDNIRKLLTISLGGWGVRDRAIIAIAAGCGLRRKELRWLKVSDINLDKNMLYVRDYGQGLKSYQERVVPIPDAYKTYIAAWLNERAAM